MKNIMMALFTVVAFMGCAQQKLHLVTQGYSANEIDGIKKGLSGYLSEQGIAIEDSAISIPEIFPEVTLALNPTFNNPHFIAELDNWLMQNGHQASTEFRFAEGNHYYNKNNFGLYLRKPGTQKQATIPPYLRTQYCDVADGTLAFNRDGKTILELEIIGDGSDRIDTYNGQWSFENNILIVDFNKFDQKFRLSQETKQTHLGERPADVFKPMSRMEGDHILNCEFLIIYMN